MADNSALPEFFNTIGAEATGAFAANVTARLLVARRRQSAAAHRRGPGDPLRGCVFRAA